MYAMLRIGDLTVTVQEVLTKVDGSDQRHTITCHDSWRAVAAEGGVGDLIDAGKPATSMVVVATEADAVLVLQAFLNLDGPDEAFRRVFPEHSS